MALTSSVLLPPAIVAVTGLVPNSSSITHLAFATVSFLPPLFFLPSAVVLCFALSICICIIKSFCLLFSVGKQEREKERYEVLQKDCWEIQKKGVCSICLIICCCWVPSEAAASFSRSKTCATHNESDGFDGRWKRVSSFSSIAIWNSERRRA